MNVKIERTANNIMRELSIIISEEVKDEYIKDVSITYVNLSSDLSHAKVYYFTLSDKKDEIASSLNRATGFFRTQLAERIDIRHTPELTFVYDESIDYGKLIEDKLKELNKE